MFEHIYQDLFFAVRYLPYSLLVGVPVSAFLVLCTLKRRRCGGKGLKAALSAAVFGLYLSVMLVITFFSRESGSRQGVDLELFSTWGINARNNALVIENVLLFIPYGFLANWAFEWTKRFLGCFLLGAGTSLAIEFSQLVTGRGYFQIDDILTNTLGTLIGFCIYLPLRCRKKMK